MKAYLLTVSLLVVVHWTNLGQCNRAEAFLDLLMEKFPSYLAANNLDPSPPYPEPIAMNLNTSNVRMDMVVTDYQIHGLSQQRLEKYFRSVNLTEGFILMEYYITSNGFWIDGNYSANGTLVYGKGKRFPVRGRGKWKASRGEENFYLAMDFNGITLSEEGYADLSKADVTGFMMFAGSIYEMDGLKVGGGNEGSVRDYILNELFFQDSGKMFPLQLQLRDYLVQAFASTPISQM